MRLLVPLDGSRRSEEILPWLGALAPAAIHVLHVAPGGAEDGAPHDCAAYARAAAARLPAKAGRAEAHAAAGDPADEILRHARRLAADLIAMRTRCRRGLSRLVFGSVTAEVLRASRLPLLVTGPAARGGGSRRRMRRLLVPLDGSARSARILAPAASLASFLGARVELLHAFRDRADPRPFEDRAAELRGHGLEASVRLVQGDPAGRILERASDGGADLVAMATHGRTGVSRLLVGSVSEAVVAAAKVPVLLLRSAAK